jgi:hypothetical protein
MWAERRRLNRTQRVARRCESGILSEMYQVCTSKYTKMLLRSMSRMLSYMPNQKKQRAIDGSSDDTL